MRLPTFSRQTATDDPAGDTRPAAAGTASETSPVRPRNDTTLDLQPRRDDTTATLPAAAKPTTVRNDPPPPPPATYRSGDTIESPRVSDAPAAPAGPKPRASLLATLSLILGVGAALLVLSGPLLGYGIGVAGLALVLALGGIHATGRRHVAGKTDALIGMVLALAAIVVGVLALTGSLSWAGTDLQPVNTAREWLDAQFANRF